MEEIIEVSGKAQKYARVRPWDFVPIDTGEQGPLCNTVDQIPNSKLIHVTFVGKRYSIVSSIALHDNESEYIQFDLAAEQPVSFDGVSKAKSVFLPQKR